MSKSYYYSGGEGGGGQLVDDTPSFLFIPLILCECELVMVKVFRLNRFDLRHVYFAHALS